MRRILGATMAALALIAVMATPAFAATITKSVAIGHGVLTCTITYTELNGNAQIDTLAEARSISNLVCTFTRS